MSAKIALFNPIAEFDHGDRQECAQVLLDRYKKASNESFFTGEGWRVRRPSRSHDVRWDDKLSMLVKEYYY